MANVFVISSNIIIIEIPTLPNPPNNSLSVKKMTIRVSNDGINAFSESVDLSVADTSCQILVNGTFRLKVIQIASFKIYSLNFN